MVRPHLSVPCGNREKVSHEFHTLATVGSIPTSATFAPLAQRSEHPFYMRGVGSSNLLGCTFGEVA
jgi:hypothetical protein